MEAFVYCWTDHLTNKLYIGVHKGTQDDGYICSSKIMKEQYISRPHDFTRTIIAAGTYPIMVIFESKILSSANAKSDNGFYNQHNGNGRFYCKGHTQESKDKIGQASKGNTNTKGGSQTPEARNKISKSLIGNKRAAGMKHTDEWKQAASDRMKTADLSHLHTPETIEKRRQKMLGRVPWNKGLTGGTNISKGRKLTEEHKANLRKPKKKKAEY